MTIGVMSFPGPPITADQLRSGAPVHLAGGGTGRHLVLQFGCRHELRQLHPLVRRHPSLAAVAARGASAFLPHYRSESRDRLQMLQVVQIVAGERLDDPLDRDLTK